jgi:hypothetical protein
MRSNQVKVDETPEARTICQDQIGQLWADFAQFSGDGPTKPPSQHDLAKITKPSENGWPSV